MQNIVTSDISKFGQRERELAKKLLSVYGTKDDRTKHLGDGIQVFMNRDSGYVFLSDEDYNVALLNGNKLEDFHSCPNCGNESVASQFRNDFDDVECCKEYADDLEL